MGRFTQSCTTADCLMLKTSRPGRSMIDARDLAAAASRGAVALRALLDQGIDINVQFNGQTALLNRNMHQLTIFFFCR